MNSLDVIELHLAFQITQKKNSIQRFESDKQTAVCHFVIHIVRYSIVWHCAAHTMSRLDLLLLRTIRS